MPKISLTDFEATKAASDRQRRLAMLLQEQSTSPIPVQSYNGVQAPISWAEPLARMLSAYVGIKGEQKAAEKFAEGRAKARTEAMDFVRGLKQETPQDRFIAPPNFQPQQTGIIDRLKAAGQSFMPQQAPPPQPMVAPQAPPQGAPMAPAQPMPMPQGPEALPQMSDMRQIPAELQNRARSPEEQQQMLMDAAMSGNPYLESIAPKMYADLEASMKTQAQRDREVEAILGMNATDDQKRQMIAAMDIGDNEAFKNVIKPPVAIQAVQGVEGLIAQKIAQGQPLTKGEQEIWDIYKARQRKMSYIAPRGGNAPKGNAPVRMPTLDEIDAAIAAKGG